MRNERTFCGFGFGERRMRTEIERGARESDVEREYKDRDGMEGKRDKMIRSKS